MVHDLRDNSPQSFRYFSKKIKGRYIALGQSKADKTKKQNGDEVLTLSGPFRASCPLHIQDFKKKKCHKRTRATFWW